MLEQQPFAGEQTDLHVHLRILETTDLHVHIMPYDYFYDKPEPKIGLAKTAGLIQRARSEVENCLLFDNGDFLQGNPMSDWAAQQNYDEVHPIIAAMNTLEYDGATLGNHEFNYGLEFLRRTLQKAHFPFVSANITVSQGKSPNTDKTFVHPWKIIPKKVRASDGNWHVLKVGIIGFAPPQIPTWEQFTLGDKIGTRDILEAARVHVPEMIAAGAEVVIALSHSGIAAEEHTIGMENASVPLAAIDGIDAILTGHTHKVFPGPDVLSTDIINATAGTLHGKPAVMAGCHGSHLGLIDLQLIKSDNKWQIAAHQALVIPVSCKVDAGGHSPATETDITVVESVRKAHNRVLDSIRLPIAHTTAPLFSHFSLVAHSPCLSLLSDAILNYAHRMVAQTRLAELPLIAAVATYKTGGRAGSNSFIDIPAGPLIARHTAEMYPFPNSLCLLEVCGHDVQDWLETAAQSFLQITPGTIDQPLIDPTYPGYNFDTLFGLNYIIDPSRPIGQRVHNVSIASTGELLSDETRLIIATNGYRAAGGGGYSAATKKQSVLQTHKPLRKILYEYLQENHLVSPSHLPAWKFAKLPETSAWFESGAGGSAHLHHMGLDWLTDCGHSREGFRRYRVSFSGTQPALPEYLPNP